MEYLRTNISPGITLLKNCLFLIQNCNAVLRELEILGLAIKTPGIIGVHCTSKTMSKIQPVGSSTGNLELWRWKQFKIEASIFQTLF